MKNTYLYRLFKHSKVLGILAMAYCAGVLLFTVLGDEVSPFFIWGMFSNKEEVKENYEMLNIKVNGESLHYSRDLWDANRHVIRSAVWYYHKIKSNDDVDPSISFFKEKLGGYYSKIEGIHKKITNNPNQYADFEAWLKRYLKQSLKKPIDQVEVSIDTYEFDEEAKPKLIRSKPFIL